MSTGDLPEAAGPPRAHRTRFHNSLSCKTQHEGLGERPLHPSKS